MFGSYNFFMFFPLLIFSLSSLFLHKLMFQKGQNIYYIMIYGSLFSLVTLKTIVKIQHCQMKLRQLRMHQYFSLDFC